MANKPRIQPFVINFNGNDSQEFRELSNRYRFLALYNNSPYVVNVYLDGQLVFVCPIYNSTTVPLNFDIDDRKINVRLEWVGTGAVLFRGLFSEEYIPTNQTYATPGGGSTVIIAGDSVGLARSAQLPAALSGGGALRVALDAAIGAGDNAIGRVKLTDGVDVGAIDALGNLMVVLGLPLPTGSNIVGKIGIDQTTPGTTNGVAITNKRGGYTDRSGTTNGADQTAAAANANRSFLFIQNISDTVIYYNFGAAASAAAGSIQLTPGQAHVYDNFVSTDAVHVYGVADKAYTIKEA